MTASVPFLFVPVFSWPTAPGGKLHTYQAGGTTPIVTYEADGSTPNANPVVLDSNGTAIVKLANATTAYHFVLKDSTDTTTLWDADNYQASYLLASGSVDSSIITYDQTAAEIAASVTPVNYAYAPGVVDRYGTNTTPGTTDMSTAFSNAAQVAGKTGCAIKWGASAPYRLNSPVNCTGIRGVIFKDESAGNASAGIPSVIIAHTGHGFDLSTSTELSFHDMVPSNLGGTVPKTVFFCARNVAGSGAGIHRFDNIRTPSACTFSWIYYGYGSEENTFTNCELYNAQSGSGIASHNATNPAGYASSFVTIATGAQSNADHRWIGGNSLVQLGNSGSHNEVCLALENFGNFTFRDGLLGNAHGLAYISVGGNTASSNLTLDSVRGEPIGTQPTYGVYVSASAGSVIHVGWTFNNVTADSSSYLLYFLNTNAPAIQNLNMRGSYATSGNLLNAYGLSNSIIESIGGNIVTGQAGGTQSANIFMGWKTNVTLSGTTNNNLFLDNFTGNLAITGSASLGGSIGLNGNGPPSQVTGWGTPTGPAIIANYSGSAATLVQTSNAVAEIITSLKNLGLFGA